MTESSSSSSLLRRIATAPRVLSACLLAALVPPTMAASHLQEDVSPQCAGSQARGEPRLEGFVVGPDGNVVEGALVVSSAGGKAETDAAGKYRLELRLPPQATRVQVTAFGGADGKLVASTSVAMG